MDSGMDGGEARAVALLLMEKICGMDTAAALMAPADWGKDNADEACRLHKALAAIRKGLHSTLDRNRGRVGNNNRASNISSARSFFRLGHVVVKAQTDHQAKLDVLHLLIAQLADVVIQPQLVHGENLLTEGRGFLQLPSSIDVDMGLHGPLLPRGQIDDLQSGGVFVILIVAHNDGRAASVLLAPNLIASGVNIVDLSAKKHTVHVKISLQNLSGP